MRIVTEAELAAAREQGRREGATELRRDVSGRLRQAVRAGAIDGEALAAALGAPSSTPKRPVPKRPREHHCANLHPLSTSFGRVVYDRHGVGTCERCHRPVWRDSDVT